MNKHYYLLVYCCLALLLFSCKVELSVDPITEHPPQDFSDSYKAPLFVDDNRVAKINELAPALEQIMIEHAKERKIPGIAYGIVVDNELVLSSATGLINIAEELSATTESSFRIASMTKSFTAMAILKLRDEGKLSLNDPVSQYIPEMAKLKYLTKDSPIIDIENLLTMTAGFPEDNPWGDRQLHESDQMLLDLIGDGVSFSNAPSYAFEYSNTGYALLGNIVSRVSGMPYQNYIKENILLPLGMEQTYWEYDDIPQEQLAIGYRWEDEQWVLEPLLHDGAFGAMGGLITSIEDFSKYVSFQLSAWPPRNEVDNGPVRRSSLREMQTPQFSRLYARATDYSGAPCALMSGYGYGLGIAQYCNGLKRVSHGGALPGFGSNYVFYPDYGIGIMAFGNLTYTGPLPANKIGKLLFEESPLKPRQLPISDILAQRQEQILAFIQSWDAQLEEEIVAENLYLDESRERRMAHAQDIFEKAGAINTVDEMVPSNQLRGTFKIQAENGVIEVYFTLTPENDPKVQKLDLSFEAKD